MVCISLGPRLSTQKWGRREPGNICRKAVDFWHLNLVVPIRLQNETMWTHDYFVDIYLCCCTNTRIVVSKMNVQGQNIPQRLAKGSWQVCERAASLSLLFTVASLWDQLTHCLSPLTGSMVCKVSCPNLLVRGVFKEQHFLNSVRQISKSHNTYYPIGSVLHISHESWHIGRRQLFPRMLPGSFLPPFLRREPGTEARSVCGRLLKYAEMYSWLTSERKSIVRFSAVTPEMKGCTTTAKSSYPLAV